ncbi:MAG: hypothetical protein U1E83_07950 [Methylotetracoccus sp.]
MKAILLRLFTVASFLFLTGAGNVALAERNQGHPTSPPRESRPPTAPEIDATAGAAALGLLSGTILLIRERRRSRRH